MNKYLGRGIHKPHFFNSLMHGRLSQMLTVINNDKDMDVQIRKDYLNIYYKGGNIAKVNSENSVEFNKFYFYLDIENIPAKDLKLDKKALAELTMKRDKLIDKFKKSNYEDYFNEAKTIMDAWFKINGKPERMEQHLLSKENQSYHSDYTIIDLEYQVSTLSDFACLYIANGKFKPKKPRFDIIAVNRQGKLCVIEFKKGTGALFNTSGLKEHLDCYQYSIGRNHESFMDEMKELLKQKQAFNLINHQIEITDPIPEFMFAYSYDNKTTVENQDKIFSDECKMIGVRVRVIKLKKGTFKLMDS